MIVLACEGETEVKLIQSLMDKGQLTFSEEIFMEGPQVIRQLNNLRFKPYINALPLDTPITVYRIGDTLRDKLSLEGFELRKDKIKTLKVCTKPECEILIIIDKGDFKN